MVADWGDSGAGNTVGDLLGEHGHPCRRPESWSAEPEATPRPTSGN